MQLSICIEGLLARVCPHIMCVCGREVQDAQFERLMYTLYKVRGDALAKHNKRFRDKGYRPMKHFDEDHMLLPLR